MPKKGDVIKGYKIIRKIGRGSFGDVFLVETVSQPREQYALKIVENIVLSDGIKVGLMLSQKCPYLVKFKDTFIDDDELNIIMEHCGGGDLENRFQQKPPLNEMDAFCFLFESGTAIKTLHDSKIIHRDIKPSNFFLETSGKYKLGDYGMARTLDSAPAKTMSRVGAAGYTCPEILKGEKTYTNKADIFSWGVTLMHFILGYNPFLSAHGYVNMELTMKGAPIEAALKHSHPLMPLALRMISEDPAKRPCADDVLNFQMSALPLLHTVLTTARGASEKVVALRPNPKGGCTLTRTPLGERGSFSADEWKTVFLDKVINEGVFRWTIKINYGNEYFTCLDIGTTLVDRVEECEEHGFGDDDNVKGSIFSVSSYKKMHSNKLNSKLYGVVDNSDIPDEETPVPDDSLVTMEVDATARILSFFVGEKRVPRAIKGVHFPLYCGVAGFGKPSFTSVAFYRIPSNSVSAVECKYYDCL